MGGESSYLHNSFSSRLYIIPSFSGLYAARVLSDHFKDILVVEPESWVGTVDGYAAVFDENGNVIEAGQKHNRARVLQHGTTHGKCHVAET